MVQHRKRTIHQFVRESTKGELSRTAKITHAIAVHIRKCAWAGVPPKELAALFGISAPAVSSIKHCRTWADVPLFHAK